MIGSHSLKYVFFIVGLSFAQKVCANVNAIDFTQIHYPSKLEKEISFLKENDRIYDHWVHDWSYSIPKDTVIGHLSLLYTEISAIPSKNEETYLLLGDLAHYLYNLELEPFYQKAVDNYKIALSLAPKDYRTYWFLANHYSLSAQAPIAIQNYSLALQFLPPKPNVHFWGDYSIACANAAMIGTAQYAAHQVSLSTGTKSYMESQMDIVVSHVLRTPPLDTVIKANDVWNFYGKKENNITFVNWLHGIKFSVDSLWGLQFGDYTNHLSYIIVKPNSIIAKDGQKIDYSILVLVKAADKDESLQQFLDKFTQKYKNKKDVSFDFSKLLNGIAIESIDPDTYPNIGGSHTYAIAFERNPPEYSGMKLEEANDLPKSGTGMNYYTMPRKYAHVNTKLYYLVLLDTCGFINNESLAIFNNYLTKLIIE